MTLVLKSAERADFSSHYHPSYVHYRAMLQTDLSNVQAE